MNAIEMAVSQRDELRREADRLEREADRAAAEGDAKYEDAADLHAQSAMARKEVDRYNYMIGGLGGEPKKRPALSSPFKKKADKQVA